MVLQGILISCYILLVLGFLFPYWVYSWGVNQKTILIYISNNFRSDTIQSISKPKPAGIDDHLASICKTYNYDVMTSTAAHLPSAAAATDAHQ